MRIIYSWYSSWPPFESGRVRGDAVVYWSHFQCVSYRDCFVFFYHLNGKDFCFVLLNPLWVSCDSVSLLVIRQIVQSNWTIWMQTVLEARWLHTVNFEIQQQNEPVENESFQKLLTNWLWQHKEREKNARQFEIYRTFSFSFSVSLFLCPSFSPFTFVLQSPFLPFCINGLCAKQKPNTQSRPKGIDGTKQQNIPNEKLTNQDILRCRLHVLCKYIAYSYRKKTTVQNMKKSERTKIIIIKKMKNKNWNKKGEHK